MLKLSILLLVAKSLAQPVVETWVYSSFEYAPNPEPTYATSVSSGAASGNYAAGYDKLSTLHDAVPTTTYGMWKPNMTNTYTDSEDQYGQSAWFEMWATAGIQNFTDTALYTDTVEPTPVPTESLVRPPPDSFKFDDSLKFPKDFVFGVAGSAAQIEGAISEHGRTPSIQEFLIEDNRPRDYVTNENYYLYKQDIARLAAIGAEHYSFTIPWSRILPFVLPGTPVNKEGIDHYDDVINTCISYGIKPIVTLTHFDTPHMFLGGRNMSSDESYFYYNGGYDNDTFVEAFVNYGKIVLTHYADRVPIFIGFNEPFLYSGNPLGMKHVVQATKQLHSFYHDEIKGCGKFGIKFNDNFGVPEDPSNPDHVAAAKRFQDIQLGSYGNPLFLGQDFPDALKETFTNDTRYLFTDEELKAASYGADFLGIDPYTYTIVSPPEGGIEACQTNTSHPLWPMCVVQSQTRSDGWKIGYKSQSYVYITPVQFREYLNYLWNTFKAPIIASEFGYPEWRESEKALGDQVYDLGRSVYYRSFMEAILQAINYDNVKVIGALAWSFADNWEFGDYEQQFGLQVVNRTTQERYYKKSFFDLVQYYQERSS